MRLKYRRLFLGAALVAFLAVSAVLARWLSTEGAERGVVVDLLEAQARGDAAGMLAEIDACGDACAERVRANAARLRQPGGAKVEIVRLESQTSRALGSTTGPTRVVWKTPGRLTVVQCIDVARTGSVLSGMSVTLRGVSVPIRRTADC